MIAEALKTIREWATATVRPTTLSVGDRQYVYDDSVQTYREVKPLIAPKKSHNFGVVSDLVDYVLLWRAEFAEQLGDEVEEQMAGVKTTILVTPDGVRAHLNESNIYQEEVLSVPFFTADMPPACAISHEQLLLYLDRHAGKIEEEEELRNALSIVRVIQGEELKVQDMGASTRISVAASKGVAAGEEHQKIQLPKYVTITLRIGTREYEEPHRFRLQATINNKAPEFRLIHLDRDGALDRFLERCKSDIEERIRASPLESSPGVVANAPEQTFVVGVYRGA